MEAAAAVAAMSEEALLLREANAEQRAKEAEGKARQLEKISRELSQRLNRKVTRFFSFLRLTSLY